MRTFDQQAASGITLHFDVSGAELEQFSRVTAAVVSPDSGTLLSNRVDVPLR